MSSDEKEEQMKEVFEFTWGTETDDEIPTIEGAVFQAVGAASTCWDSLEGAGVFDSTRAKEIGDKLIAFIEEDSQPMLGCATTAQLIDELQARASVAETVGETWPRYRTTDTRKPDS